MQTTGNLRHVSLYFHIPFCTRKCHYCHFYVLPDKEASKDLLLEGFRLEWEHWLPSLTNTTITSIYFGGGTPFLFGPDRIAATLDFIKQHDPHVLEHAEITLEANPENVTLQAMQAYQQAGINRVSLGIQTLDNSLLQLLGRLHHAHTATDAVHMTAEAGIRNISIDLMYDLPNQTFNQWQSTLNEVSGLPITHLSLYNLTIEPYTVFFKKQEQLRPLLPDETESLKMYQTAIQVLEAHGLKQYEISAFSKPGYGSRHNIGYWTARPFLGFGPSAFSYWNFSRFRNVAHLKKYHDALKSNQSPIDFQEQLEEEAHRRELLVIRLRLKEGVCLTQFQHQHGHLDTDTWETLNQLQTEGFIHIKDSLATLTPRGVLFYDTVAAELI